MVSKERLQRNKSTQEFFTPAHIVAEIVEEVPNEFFVNLVPFKETTVGNGNIVSQIVDKFKQYHSLENILKNIQLSDIMEDNCIETIKRLCGDVKVEVVSVPNNRQANGLISMFKVDGNLVEWIVQADATKFVWWQKEQFGNGLFEFEE
jgi:hypothetical protein